ncbi:MAG: amidase family protein [Alphaproteobacteria bacterium]|nr:amidase family protein [Alphaproteobacteria bacterium]
MISELCRLSAREAVRRLKRKEIKPEELIEAAAARIAEVEPKVNALPTLCLDRARESAKRIDALGKTGASDHPGWLAGLPIAIKDLNDVAGVRTTYGSPIFTNHVPQTSDIMVETLEARGAVVIAKSNTPEFGAGANTFNEVFGKTLNPWNTALTCGGSSGGAAVALATGEVWLASGSDLGGSLRTPASFCSVVGLRPTPGRVAHGPKPHIFDSLSVDGPMGRDVRDTALLLDAQAGVHPRDPISLEYPARSFQDAIAEAKPVKRVGFSPDLGVTPVEREVREICAAAAKRFGDVGAKVDEATPDLKDAQFVFQTLRAFKFATDRSKLLADHRDKLKADVIWNIEQGQKLDAGIVGRAEHARGTMCRNLARYFESHDILACPAAIVPPFDVNTRYIAEVEGHKFDNYIDWVLVTYAITVTGYPAISVPCGFTKDGRPVGLQLVAPPRGEAALLAAAAQLEDVLGLAAKVPIDPRPGTP